MRLDDPQIVHDEYANEKALLTRRSAYERAVHEGGRGPWEVMFEAVAEPEPRLVLDVGCGPGDIAERIAREITRNVIAVDVSPRMVELTRARGVDARVADVRDLSFEDESFDVTLAAWMLYHVADLGRALQELGRVLVRGGRLVAVTTASGTWQSLATLPASTWAVRFRSAARTARRSYGACSTRSSNGTSTAT